MRINIKSMAAPATSKLLVCCYVFLFIGGAKARPYSEGLATGPVRYQENPIAYCFFPFLLFGGLFREGGGLAYEPSVLNIFNCFSLLSKGLRTNTLR